MNETNLRKFDAAYRENLHRMTQARPGEYPWLGTRAVGEVADKMVAAIRRGDFNKDGSAIKATCKELGIKHTYKAIAEFLA